MTKTRLTLVGAGKIGEAIVTLLDETGDYDVTIVDQNPEQLRFFRNAGLRTRACVLTTPPSWLRSWRSSRS
jgi:saccharopine dehydrogenase-like NADP-dependent oxidoreductase